METPIAFPEEIANVYDTIMHYFDYKTSARLIDDIIKRNKPNSKPSLLELGIGTGSLAIELQQLGYSIEGIDQSQAMLTRAIKKGLSLQSLHEGDVTNFSLGKEFGVLI